MLARVYVKRVSASYFSVPPCALLLLGRKLEPYINIYLQSSRLNSNKHDAQFECTAYEVVVFTNRAIRKLRPNMLRRVFDRDNRLYYILTC